MNVSHAKARIDRLHMFLNELDEEIKQKNEIINKSETEIVHRNAIIERKQGVIDQYNKRLEQMIAKAGVGGATLMFKYCVCVSCFLKFEVIYQGCQLLSSYALIWHRVTLQRNIDIQDIKCSI